MIRLSAHAICSLKSYCFASFSTSLNLTSNVCYLIWDEGSYSVAPILNRSFLRSYGSLPIKPLDETLVKISSTAAFDGAQTWILVTPAFINIEMIPVIV
jgi:hypothetical protein